MEKQAAKGDFLRLGFVRLLLSFYWEQGALFFVLGPSAGHLCAKTVVRMLIQFSPGISRRLCYLCGMLILTLRGDRCAIGKEPGKAEPFREYGTPQQAVTAPDRRAGTAFSGKPAGAWADKGDNQHLPPQPLQAAEIPAGGQQSGPRLSLQLAVGTVGAGLFPRHRK